MLAGFINFVIGPLALLAAIIVLTRFVHFHTFRNHMYALETQVCKLDLSGGIRAGARLRALTQLISTTILPDHACT